MLLFFAKLRHNADKQEFLQKGIWEQPVPALLSKQAFLHAGQEECAFSI